MRDSKRDNRVILLTWNSRDVIWQGWHGFTGVYKDMGSASEKLNRNNLAVRAQLLDYKTLKVLKTLNKREDGSWSSGR